METMCPPSDTHEDPGVSNFIRTSVDIPTLSLLACASPLGRSDGKSSSSPERPSTRRVGKPDEPSVSIGVPGTRRTSSLPPREGEAVESFEAQIAKKLYSMQHWVMTLEAQINQKFAYLMARHENAERKLERFRLTFEDGATNQVQYKHGQGRWIAGMFAC